MRCGQSWLHASLPLGCSTCRGELRPLATAVEPGRAQVLRPTPYCVLPSPQPLLRSFGQECGPRGKCTFAARLADDDIRKLAEFVKQNADAGWPQ